MASLLTVPPFSGSSGRQESNSDSDASFLSDLEEVDHMKLGSANGENEDQQLQFVDSYFRQDASCNLSDPALDLFSLEESLNGTLPPWERLSDWVHCFCVVTFDLEIGQMIEVLYCYIKAELACIVVVTCHCKFLGDISSSCYIVRD